MDSKKRCAIYTRTACETIHREQTVKQHRCCREFVQQHHDWLVVERKYSDSCVSGLTLHKPALTELLRDAENGAIDIVVMTNASRLHRGDMCDYSDYFVQEFKRRGAEVAFVEHAWP